MKAACVCQPVHGMWVPTRARKAAHHACHYASLWDQTEGCLVLLCCFPRLCSEINGACLHSLRMLGARAFFRCVLRR